MITAREETAEIARKASFFAFNLEKLFIYYYKEAKKAAGITTEPSTESGENGNVEVTSAEDENSSTKEKTYVLTDETIDKIAENIYKATMILRAAAEIQTSKETAEKAAKIAETVTTVAEAKAAANSATKAFEAVRAEVLSLTNILP